MKGAAKKTLYRLFDILSVPFTVVLLPLLRTIRKHGVHNFPLNRSRFISTGVFPVRDHYYEPQLIYSAGFDPKKQRQLFIDFNLPKQLRSLKALRFIEELAALPAIDPGNNRFFLDNGMFGRGDSDLYYLLLRNTRPKRVIEIGCGYSTKVCLDALQKNNAEGYPATLTCIEPYAEEWLRKSADIRLMAMPAEQVALPIFTELQENDILFIDSSHVIRPENDVLFEYLQLLPALNPGVIIHIHDIFSPRHYPAEWLQQEFRFWNEQYLLEAFLYYNESFEIMYTLNHLKNDAFAETAEVLTSLRKTDEPSSFWLRKVK
jgi:hypothetical protein